MGLNWRGPRDPVQGWIVLHGGALSILAGVLGLGLERRPLQVFLASLLLMIGVVFCTRGLRLVRQSRSNQ